MIYGILQETTKLIGKIKQYARVVGLTGVDFEELKDVDGIVFGMYSDISQEVFPLTIVDGKLNGLISQNFEPEKLVIELVGELKSSGVDVSGVTIRNNPSKLDILAYENNIGEISDEDMNLAVLEAMFMGAFDE